MAKKEKINKHPDWRLSGKERRNYVMSDLSRLFGTGIFQMFMTAFLALRGVNLGILAGVMLILKIIDAVDDVVFGYIIDKLKITEWKLTKKIAGDGKYLPWFRLTFALFPIFTILFYLMPNSIPEWAKLTWFVVTYLLYDFSCTLCEVPMNSLIMTLTDNTDERNHVLTIRGLMSVISGVVLALAVNFLVDPVTGPGLSFSSVSIGTMLLCVVLMLPLVFSGKEYNTKLKNVEGDANESYTLRDMWDCIKTNKFMAIYLLSTLIAGVTATGNAVGALTTFYLFGGRTLVASLPVAIAFFPAILINTQADKIAKRFGRRNSLILLQGTSAIMGIILYLVGYESIALYITLGVFSGLCNSLLVVFRNFIAPDTIEYTRYKTGKDCSGIFYSLQSFVTKATTGVGTSIGLFILGLYGWREVQANSYEELMQMGVEVGQAGYQTPQAIHGMWVVHALVPAVGALIAALVLLLYRLKDKDAELMAKCNAGEISREECEARLSMKN